MRILAVGGGSGGHVTPVVAVLDSLNQIANQPIEVRFICDKSFESQTRKIMSCASVPVTVSVISAGKFRRYKHFKLVDYITTPSVVIKNIIDVVKIAIGTIQASWIIWRFKPQVIFAKGGFVSLPVGYAARLFRIPLIIHDSDVRPGLTNRLLSPFAKAIATGYPLENYPYSPAKSHYTGVPIAQSISVIDEDTKRNLKTKLGIDPDNLLVVSIGGGLGSQSINSAMLKINDLLDEYDASAVLVAGKADFENVQAQAQDKLSLVIKNFMANNELLELLGAADIVVSRASATTLQELAGLAKPVIAIPARALGDQHKNADFYQAKNAAIILSDDDLDNGMLTGVVGELLSSASHREQLSDSIKIFAKPNAAMEVAQLIVDVVSKKNVKK